jgi:hypothetical protein
MAAGESVQIDDFNRSRNFDLEKPNARLKSRNPFEANVRDKTNVVTDVPFRENGFINDWIIKNDCLNRSRRKRKMTTTRRRRKRKNAILGENW